MRIPFPLVLVLCLVTLGGVWWQGTRKLDFLTPPSPEHLALVRARVAATLPPLVALDDVVISPPPPEPAPAPVEPPPPAIDPNDLTAPLTLDAYRDLAPTGAAHLIRLAILLETEGELQRALLAWERVVDATTPDASQATTAHLAIQRLRSTLANWNNTPTKALPITLHAETDRKTAKALAPLLNAAASELEASSAGLLKVTAHIATRQNRSNSAPAVVTLWLTGAAQDSPATAKRSLTAAKPELLHEEIVKATYQIVRDHSGLGPAPAPSATAAPVVQPIDITRLTWQTVGKKLNPTSAVTSE